MNVDISSGYYDPFGRLVSEMVDRDTAKKWIDKTFDIASEFNKDFATIAQEQETNDKNLRKTRDLFVSVFDSLYDNDQDHTEVVGDDTKPSPDPVENDSSVNTDIDNDLKQAMKKVTETPNWENRSNDKIFSVAIDLPGVNRADIEISIEGDDVLILRAKRDTGSEENSHIVRIYTAEIALPEANQIDVEKLEATMKNGVLVITAPKHKPSEKRRTIQIS
jgi:HSP20 family molecular chaperone IbpA